MTPNYSQQARELVLDCIFADPVEAHVHLDEVFVVWFCKTLKNWKALVSTDRSDGRYYELTYNGEKEETYIDVYFKTHNECIRDVDR